MVGRYGTASCLLLPPFSPPPSPCVRRWKSVRTYEQKLINNPLLLLLLPRSIFSLDILHTCCRCYCYSPERAIYASFFFQLPANSGVSPFPTHCTTPAMRRRPSEPFKFQCTSDYVPTLCRDLASFSSSSSSSPSYLVYLVSCCCCCYYGM